MKISVAIFGRLRPNWSFSESFGRKIFCLVALVVLVVFGLFGSFWSFSEFLAILTFRQNPTLITSFFCVLMTFQVNVSKVRKITGALFAVCQTYSITDT